MFSKALIFLTLLVLTTLAIKPRCVWYHKGTFCGMGDNCPKEYPTLAGHGKHGDYAPYCGVTFGTVCLTGEKNLCCNNAALNLEDEDTYECGHYD